MDTIRHTDRKIIHVDMDCFYAAVEMRDDPALQDIPLAVGGRADSRGVISTCNYIAREFGIHSAMATAYAIKLCPGLKVIPGRMGYYKTISKQIRAIFNRYTDIIEPLSLDEAFLDVSDSNLFHGSATLIARDIRRSIKRELNLTASAGIAPNKFLAKICSDENKPDGQAVVTPLQLDRFVAKLPLAKIAGVGQATLKKLHANGLYTCGDVRPWQKQALIRRFGSFGEVLHARCHGIDDRELTTDWVRKSLSVEKTFARDILELENCEPILEQLFTELSRRLGLTDETREIRNQQVKLKFTDFQSTTIERASSDLSKELFYQLLPLAWDRGHGLGIRLMGLGVSFQQEDEQPSSQLPLFEDW